MNNKPVNTITVPWRKSIRFRLTLTTLLTSLLVGAVMMIFLDNTYRIRIESEYNHIAVALTNTAAAMVDGETVDRYLSTLERDEEYYRILDQLTVARNEFGVAYLVISRIDEEKETFVFDAFISEDDHVELGETVELNDFIKSMVPLFLSGARIDPYINDSPWGRLLVAGEPIFRKDGSVSAYAFTSISMEEILSERQNAITLLGLLIGAIVLVNVILNLLVIYRRVMKPMKILVSSSFAFEGDDTGARKKGEPQLHSSARPDMEPQLHSGDEFEVLEQALLEKYTLAADYAETKRREESLAEQNEFLDGLNRTKTEFLQDMSHEMKAPMTVIATGIDFADMQLKTENGNLSEAGEALETVREETQRLGRMVSGMVTMASMSEVGENRKRVDFAALLNNSAEAFRVALKERGNSLDVEIAEGLPDVFVENDRFVQVMANMFNNANENTDDGLITLKADQDGKYIIVSMTDTGTGIEPELLPRVFERGVSGSGSTGYGLYICKTVVEAHGGSIAIESEPGKGTTANFTVPVYAGQEAGHM